MPRLRALSSFWLSASFAGRLKNYIGNITLKVLIKTNRVGSQHFQACYQTHLPTLTNQYSFEDWLTDRTIDKQIAHLGFFEVALQWPIRGLLLNTLLLLSCLGNVCI